MENLNYKLISSDDELEKALDVRRQVFIKEQGIPEEIELDECDKGALHIVVKDGDSVIATARASFPTDGLAKIERMAVLRDFRRRGIGERIVSFLSEEFRKRKVKQIVLHAQYAVVDFYRSCGFEETGEPFLEAGIKHIKMHKKI
ncbi:GNAT family N-acetyltransferase [Chloroflexota bacterium]